MKTQLLNQIQKSLSVLTIALVLPTLAHAGGNVTGGGEPKKISAAALKLLIEGSGLKNAMLNYVKTAEVSKIDDVRVRETFKRMAGNGVLEADIQESKYYVGTDCKDAYDQLVPASTEVGHLKSSICFNVKMLEADYKNLSEEVAMIRLAGLAFHEHAHHFQSSKQTMWKSNEEAANRLAGYVLITAKFVQLPILKWTSPSDTPIEFASIEALYQEIKAKEQVFLSPSPSDYAMMPGYQGRLDRGVIKLLPREKYDGKLSVGGGGAYYSFKSLSHNYNDGSDIELQQKRFSVGFAGCDFGSFQAVSRRLDDITADTQEIAYLANFVPASKNEPEVRKQQQRAIDDYTLDGVEYKGRVEFKVGSTFVLRSTVFDRHDILVALQVLKINDDGSAVIAWKKLKEYPTPSCR